MGSIARAIVHVTSGLHAKGYVLLDLKPELLMMYDKDLKIADVDGCVEIGASISMHEATLSFCPCFCSPEWAAFIMGDGDDRTIVASPSLDAWSVGLCISQAVTLSPVQIPVFSSFARRSWLRGSFEFLEWLAFKKDPPIPGEVAGFDTGLEDLLKNYLLICDPPLRRSLAETLSHKFLAKEQTTSAYMRTRRGNTLNLVHHAKDIENTDYGKTLRQSVSAALEDSIIFRGELWKLNDGADPKDKTQWLRRDMWIDVNGSLCYFSHHHDKGVVLKDGHCLSMSSTSEVEGGCFISHAFRISSSSRQQDASVTVLGCTEADTYNMWIAALETAKAMQDRSMYMGKTL